MWVTFAKCSRIYRTSRFTASSPARPTGEWGLRDYGTGQWDGGDPDCDHSTPRSRGDDIREGDKQGTSAGSRPNTQTVCKCGATRVDRQLGLEPTPDEYVENMVAVFREVRRVLRADGTCWINLGDSYAGTANGRSRFGQGGAEKTIKRPGYESQNEGGTVDRPLPPGLKPKDLVGIPWSVAKALQEPYYTGRIKSERDRVWLAATIDAEGSICGFTHERADGDGTRTGIHVTITNTSMAMLAEAQRIWPTSRDDGNAHSASALGTRECRRWIAHSVSDKADLLGELYPYLIAKKRQALLAWNFLEMSKVAKRIGKLTEGAVAKERRAWIVGALSDLNHGREVDVPAWIKEPPTLYEEGWYLRADVIWSKPNPMPESVSDRPTKAHEYLFLLTRSKSYFYDADAIREPAEWARWGDQTNGKHEGQQTGAGWIGSASKEELQRRQVRTKKPDGWATHEGGHGSFHRDGREAGVENYAEARGRNRRSVWEIATEPYPDAHFATFPQALVEPCVKAGTSEWGCCAECGAPWERLVMAESPDGRRAEVRNGKAYDENGQPLMGDNMFDPGVRGSFNSGGATLKRETVGWRSSCAHEGDPVPCTVLDPFLGSGTTALVARRLGRRSVGIELSPDYAELAARRLAQLSLLA